MKIALIIIIFLVGFLVAALLRADVPPKSPCTLSRGRLICPEVPHQDRQ